MPTDLWRAKAEQKIQMLLHDPLIIQFRAQYPHLNEHDLRTHIGKIHQYVLEHTNCSNCSNLEQCPNDFVGHCTQLRAAHLNGSTYVYDCKVACQKFMDDERQQQIQKRIRSFYVDEMALRRGYSAAEILGNDPGRIRAVSYVIEYIKQTKQQGLKRTGLFLYGSFGTGKTFLMSYVLYELARLRYTGVIVYMPEFVEELKAMLQQPLQLRETIEMMKETDILVFDDIGAENITPWVRDHVLGSILTYRMNRKPTFYTSNYPLETLQEHFSFTREGEEIYKAERVMNRITPFVDVIEVQGRNKRGVE